MYCNKQMMKIREVKYYLKNSETELNLTSFKTIQAKLPSRVHRSLILILSTSY